VKRARRTPSTPPRSADRLGATSALAIGTRATSSTVSTRNTTVAEVLDCFTDVVAAPTASPTSSRRSRSLTTFSSPKIDD
jgi:hypothetical protein